MLLKPLQQEAIGICLAVFTGGVLGDRRLRPGEGEEGNGNGNQRGGKEKG
jgi:hypothetical protein